MADAIEKLALVLQKHGAWSITIVLGAVVIYLARYALQQQREIQRLQDVRVRELSALLVEHRDDTKEVVEALVNTQHAIDSMRQVMTSMLHRLEHNDASKTSP